MIIIKKSILFFNFYIKGNNHQFLTVKKQDIFSEIKKPIYTNQNKNTLIIIDSRILFDLKEEFSKILLELYLKESIYILYFYPFIKKRKFFYKSGVDELKTKKTKYINNNKKDIPESFNNNNNNNENCSNNNNNEQISISKNKNNKINRDNNKEQYEQQQEEETKKLLGIIKKDFIGNKYILPINKSIKNNPYIIDNIIYNKFIKEEIIFYLIKLKEKTKEIKHIIYITYDKKAETIINNTGVKLTIIYIEKK